MQRAKVLAIGATLLCATVGTALADEPPPGGGGDGTGSGSGSGGEMMPPPVEGGGGGGMWSESVIDRDDVLPKGHLAVYGGLGVASRVVTTTTGMPPMTTSSTVTSEGLSVGGGYGITPKLTAGLEYAFSLHDFEIKGPLTLYAGFAAMHSGKLHIGVGGDLVLDFAGETQTLNIGAVVRYQIAPKIEIFTGDPIAPGPMGEQITIGFNSGTPIGFDLPVGAGFQAMPKLYIFADTQLAHFALHSGANKFIFADSTPLVVGALYAVNKTLDVGAEISDDFNAAGDYFALGLMARYYK